jgi:hypothetical protein
MPPAAKEKLLKKFLFGISSKRFIGRREESRHSALLRDASCKIVYEHNSPENPFPTSFH